MFSKKIFCERLREQRTTMGFTQQQFAEALGTYKQKVSKWENGTHEPNLETLCRIAEILDISADYFLGVGEDISETEITSNKKADVV